MEGELQFADRRMELDEKIRALETEKVALMEAIEVLREKQTTLRLESRARKLEDEVIALRSEKTLLEEEIAQTESSAAENIAGGSEVSEASEPSYPVEPPAIPSESSAS